MNDHKDINKKRSKSNTKHNPTRSVYLLYKLTNLWLTAQKENSFEKGIFRKNYFSERNLVLNLSYLCFKVKILCERNYKKEVFKKIVFNA